MWRKIIKARATRFLKLVHTEKRVFVQDIWVGKWHYGNEKNLSLNTTPLVVSGNGMKEVYKIIKMLKYIYKTIREKITIIINKPSRPLEHGPFFCQSECSRQLYNNNKIIRHIRKPL